MSSINLTGVGLREGVKMKNTATFLQRLSKAATPGGQYRLFFPKIKNADGTEDVIAAAATGRALDFKIFGSAFMTYKNEWWESGDAGIKKDLINLDSYARIARIIFEAQCEREKEDAKAEAENIAQQNGGEVDSVALIRKLDKIDEKYHGREGGEGVQRTFGTVSPSIRGLATQIIVELLMVPMDSTSNTPQWDKAEYVYKEFSKKVMNTIISLLDNPAFNDPSKPYLEVAFTYGTANQTAKQAGQDANYNGVTSALGLETMFPESWASTGKDKVANIIDGKREPDEAGPIILAHSGYIQGRLTPQDIDAKLRQWVASNLVVLTHINMADPSTVKGAKDLVDSGLVDGINQVKNKLIELASTATEAEANNESSAQTVAPTPAPAPAPAPQETVASVDAPTSVPDTQPTLNSVPETMAGTTLESIMQNNSAGVDLPEGATSMRDAAVANVAEDEEELGDLL